MNSLFIQNVIHGLHVPAARSAEATGQNIVRHFGPRVSPMMGGATKLSLLSGVMLDLLLFVGGLKWIWPTGAGTGLNLLIMPPSFLM